MLILVTEISTVKYRILILQENKLIYFITLDSEVIVADRISVPVLGFR